MVRVDFAQLDHLLNLVGELIIHRTKLQQLGQASWPSSSAAARRAASCRPRCSRSRPSPRQLQETVMDVRMLPIRHVFERFPRLVRDLARQTGKDIELILEGEDTRIDKAIIDEIGEPLVHLIRNSVDHGIETPAERVAPGQDAHGHDPALRGPGVEPRRDHDHGRRLAASTPRSVQAKAVARGPAEGRRGALRARRGPAHLRPGLLHRARRSPRSPAAGWASTWC